MTKLSNLPRKIKHKFNAKPTTVDDTWFGSKREAARYQELKLLQKAGEVIFFLMQTPFRLPGKIKYVTDFMIFWSDGNVTFEDVKGFMTPLSRNKIAMVEDLYEIEITIVK